MEIKRGSNVTYKLASGVVGSATVRRVDHSDWPIANQTLLFVTWADVNTTGTIDARFVTGVR